jgi:hypothetical protein
MHRRFFDIFREENVVIIVVPIVLSRCCVVGNPTAVYDKLQDSVSLKVWKEKL